MPFLKHILEPQLRQQLQQDREDIVVAKSMELQKAQEDLAAAKAGDNSFVEGYGSGHSTPYGDGKKLPPAPTETKEQTLKKWLDFKQQQYERQHMSPEEIAKAQAYNQQRYSAFLNPAPPVHQAPPFAGRAAGYMQAVTAPVPQGPTMRYEPQSAPPPGAAALKLAEVLGMTKAAPGVDAGRGYLSTLK